MTLWQRQKSGDSSQNIQAQVANFGVSYSDARDIAMDVFRQNFLQLSQEAMQVAHERVERFTVNYLQELHGRDSKAIAYFQDPGVQYSLLEGQSCYARSGDDHLGQLLVDLLVERTLRPQRSTEQLALDEAIATSGRLSRDHFRMLSLLTIRDVVPLPSKVTHFKQLILHYISHAGPFLDGLHFSRTDARYLAATGCVSLGQFEESMVDSWRRAYPYLLFKGGPSFSQPPSDEYRKLEKYFMSRWVQECLKNPDGGPASDEFFDNDEFDRHLDELGSEKEFRDLYHELAMTAKEIYQVSLEIDPRLAQMTSLINESFPHGVGLTTVGSVIGNAYMRIPPGETEERGNSLG